MSLIWTRQVKNFPLRADHASAAVGHIIYSFGGVDITHHTDYIHFRIGRHSKRPIVVRSLDTNTLEWSSVPYTYDSMDDIPFNRYGHTVITDGHMIYLWGGSNGKSNGCNVLFAFNSRTLKWSRPKVSGVIPDARHGHAATVCGRKMYIFGGGYGYCRDSRRYFQDVHSLDLDTFTWNYIVTEGIPPASRSYHSLSCIDETLYVFGGSYIKEGSSDEEVYENEIVCLDLRSLTWSRPVTKNAPIGRTSYSAFVFNKCLYIFGGLNNLLTPIRGLNDLHLYNPVTREWTEVSTQGAPPRPCEPLSCNLVKSQLFIFGGINPAQKFRPFGPTDLFVLDLSPSLETLTKHAIIKHGLSTTPLPPRMQKEISDMAENIST